MTSPVVKEINGAHERLGDAVMAAQAAYADTGALPELLLIYQLLGTPHSTCDRLLPLDLLGLGECRRR